MGASELAMVLTSAALHAVWSVAIKGSRDPLAFNLLQTLMMAALALVLIPVVALPEVPPSVWGVLAITGVAHALYMYCLSRAFSAADLSLVYPIARSTPAFLPFFAVPLLGERISWTGALGIAVVVSGVWLVNGGRELRWGSLFGPKILFAYLTLATTVAYGLLDKLGMSLLNDADWSGPMPRSVFYFFASGVACAVYLLPLCLTRLSWSELGTLTRLEWGRALSAGLISLGSYGLILEALRTASASYVVATRQSSVLFAVLLSIVWLREQPGRARVAGAVATVGGVALIALSK